MSDHKQQYKDKVLTKAYEDFVGVNKEYLEKAKKIFLKEKGLTFRDGTYLSPEYIWDWIFVKDAPEKYPNIFIGFEGYDLESPSIIKFIYLYYSFYDRLIAASDKGVLIVNRKETIPDMFYALGSIPIRGGAGAALRHQRLSVVPDNFEACGAGSAWAWKDNRIPFGAQVVPTGVHCYDTPNNALAVHRAGKVDIPIFYLDNPIGSGDAEWAIDYRVKTLRRAAGEIAKLNGATVDDERLRREIIIGNKVRKAVWRIYEVQGESEQPPFTAHEFETIIHAGHNWTGEPEAFQEVLEGIAVEAKDRQSHRVHGTVHHKNPVRIFVGGACTHFRPLIGHTSGAVPVGVEWFLVPSHGSLNEEGDPFRALVEGSPLKSLTVPLEEHADWIVDRIRESKAEGFIYGYKWGCNFASSAAHVITDVVKKKTGIPTLIMETDFIGKQANESGGGLTRVEAFIEILKANKRGKGGSLEKRHIKKPTYNAAYAAAI
jgi:hypothetical protein